MKGNESEAKSSKASEGDDGEDGEGKHREIDIRPAVQRELDALPEHIRNQFIVSLEAIAIGMAPLLKFSHLSAAGPGVIELKINGSPAYRCMYHLKTPGKVTVLHATAKTTNGTDMQLIKTTKRRLKSIK